MSFSYPFFVIIVLFFVCGNQSQETERYCFDGPFKTEAVDSVAKVFVNFNDTISNDTLYFCYSDRALKAVYREITTGVCLDGECRPIRITLFWTLTGRYLGFLLKNQELTKKEHTPFTESEYRLLHSLLSDSLSVLKNFTLEEIHPKKEQKVKTDGITGATPPNISSYIVPEAAYTTHTLWHLVYGETPDSIVRSMTHRMNAVITDSLLKSDNVYDRLWALNHLPENLRRDSFVMDYAFGMLHDKNVTVVKAGLNFLQSQPLPDSVFQESLFRLSQSTDFFIRNLAFEQWKKIEKVHPFVAGKMINRFPGANLSQLNHYLAILEHYTPSDEDLTIISRLLLHSESQVSLNVYSYLVKYSDQKPWLAKKLKKYDRRNSK